MQTQKCRVEVIKEPMKQNYCMEKKSKSISAIRTEKRKELKSNKDELIKKTKRASSSHNFSIFNEMKMSNSSNSNNDSDFDISNTIVGRNSQTRENRDSDKTKSDTETREVEIESETRIEKDTDLLEIEIDNGEGGEKKIENGEEGENKKENGEERENDSDARELEVEKDVERGENDPEIEKSM